VWCGEQSRAETHFGGTAVIMRFLRKAAHVAFEESGTYGMHHKPTNEQASESDNGKKKREIFSIERIQATRGPASRIDGVRLLFVKPTGAQRARTIECPDNKRERERKLYAYSF
jgi:hypothetical protein